MESTETELVRLRAAVGGTLTPIMMIDRDLVVTYVNEATRTLMRKHESTLRSLYAGFDAERLVGSCIDMFHRDPSHQRRILANPANLPFSADIKVGPLTLNINVTAQVDPNGSYIGCTLEWNDVTEQRLAALEVARLQSALQGATTNLMMCDENFVITYANPAVREMFRRRADVFRNRFPGFDPDRLIGTCIDVFHRNPAHQRGLLHDRARLPAKAEIALDGIALSVNATAISDNKGNFIGNMVEWNDITEQKDAEREVTGLLQAAMQGELDRRIDSTRFQGFMKGLCEGINSLMDAVVRPIGEVGEVVAAMARGDLRQQMQGDYAGRFLTLKEELNGCVSTLSDTVSQIRSASSSITSAAGEISQGNTDLSQRTEEQASSLEETAASIEELTSTVKQNADNAREASQLAVSAREQAAKGGDVVQNAVVAMGAINESSKKIADIIGVIDEIAFQTNLLALNAAVEAARAGEQGRGFAVVASEVRNLAQRSAGAAKEIKTLINDSVRKVDEGSKLVNASGLTLTEIVTSVRRVADIIAEIAAASAEQSSGIDQVNRAVGQMDQVTQQNAALVEEAAAAAESLDDQARALLEVVGFFETGDAARAAFTPARGASSQTRPRAGRAPHATQQRPTPARAAASRPLSAPATARTGRPALQPRMASTARAAVPHPARPALARPDAARPAFTAPVRPPEAASADDWEDF
jgi:methyl-accepting chemotaxis protein